MLNTIIVREARMEDLPQIQALTKKLWKQDPKIKQAFPRWMQSDWIPEAFPKWISNENDHPLVAEDVKRNQVVGVVNAELIDQGETAWFEGIRIDPDYQRLGVGRMLTEELLRWGQKLPTVKQFRLVALNTNQASLSLTRKLGFKDVNFLNGYNIPIVQFSPEERKKYFYVSPTVLDGWQEVKEDQIDDVVHWFKNQWTSIAGHPTIGLGGLFLTINKANIEYLMSGWTFIAKLTSDKDIQGIILLRGSRTRTELVIPSRAILCVPEMLAKEAILVGHHHLTTRIEPKTTDLRILGRVIDDTTMKSIFPQEMVSSFMRFSPVLMEKQKNKE